MSSQERTEDRIRVDTPEQISLEFPLAGIGSRFLAVAVDTLLQFLLYIAGIFAMIGTEKYAGGWFSWLSGIPGGWAEALLIVFLFCVYWGYFAFFEIVWKGQTPGKRLAGIRVIHKSGRAVNVYEIIGRNLLRGVDFLPSMYITGIIAMMISRQNQRLGDMLVGSIVVHDKRSEEIRPHWAATSAANAPSHPQLSQITPEELVLIESYLQRRSSFELLVRDATAQKIAERIRARTGLERAPGQSLDDFLESVARQVRDGARLR